MAENTDGSIIFDTALDNTGFKKGSAKMESAVKSLVGSVNNLGKKIDTGFSNGNAVLSFTAKLYDAQTRAAELQAMLAQLGSQQIATQQYTDLSKQIERAEKSLLGLYDRRDAMQDAGVSEYSKEWKALEKQIQKAEIQLEGFENKRALMVESGEAFVSGADTEEYARTKAILEQTQIELENSRRLVASEALEQARLNVQAAQEKVIRAQKPNAPRRKPNYARKRKMYLHAVPMNRKSAVGNGSKPPSVGRRPLLSGLQARSEKSVFRLLAKALGPR